MVHMASGGRVMRVHGPFVSDDEIERVTGFLKEKSRPQYGGIHEVDLDDSGHAESGTAGQTMCINRPWPLCCVTVNVHCFIVVGNGMVEYRFGAVHDMSGATRGLVLWFHNAFSLYPIHVMHYAQVADCDHMKS
jgi:DNA segregation ATPase FtsK/SpoIIIE-like protein